MKQSKTLALALASALTLAACGTAGTTSTPAASTPATSAPAEKKEAGTPGAILDEITGDFDEAIATLRDQLETTMAGLGGSYEDYPADSQAFLAWYSLAQDTAAQLYEDTQSRAIDYYRAAVDSVDLKDKDAADTLEDAMDDFYDAVYEDAFDDLYDEIYDDAFGDIYDEYYTDVLRDYSADIEDYSAWSDTGSEFYSGWSDARSDFYAAWSDARSTLYSTHSDFKWAFYDNNYDVDSILDEIAAEAEATPAPTETSPTPTAEPTAEPTAAPTEEPTSDAADGESGDSGELVDGMRPEFKEAMDSYEEFFDEYCNIMQKYAESDGTDLGLLTDYVTFMGKYASMMQDLEAWESEDMNDTEAAYYLEVTARITQKLLAVAGQ